MRAFAHPARKALIDKRGVEDGVGKAVDGMLHDQIPECGCKDRAYLWLVHQKLVIGLRLVGAAMQFGVQCVKVGPKVATKLQCGALAPLAVAGIFPGLVERLHGEGLFKQEANTFHRRAPRRSTATWQLLEKGRPADLAMACTTRRKAPP